MSRSRKSDTRAVANDLQILHLSPFPVLPAKEQQRIALLHHDILDFRNKDRVIPGILGRVQPAFQVRQRTVQNRRAVAGAVEARSGFGFGVFMRAFRTGIILRNGSLILAQHIDPKALLGMQMRVRARAVVDANQHQHGIERHRGKRVGRHAVDFAIEVDRNDGDPGGKSTPSPCEIPRDSSSSRRNVACNVSIRLETLPRDGKPSSDATAYITMRAPLYHSIQRGRQRQSAELRRAD